MRMGEMPYNQQIGDKMPDSYTKEKGCFNSWEDESEDPYSREKEPTVFHIGSYNDIPARKITCKNCGGDSFNVGIGFVFTAVRCVTCEWEFCVHEG